MTATAIAACEPGNFRGRRLGGKARSCCIAHPGRGNGLCLPPATVRIDIALRVHEH